MNKSENITELAKALALAQSKMPVVPMDFCTFMSNRYCPKSVDPAGNTRWIANVSKIYERGCSESPARTPALRITGVRFTQPNPTKGMK